MFVKFDGVTRLRKHYLGINIQYWDAESGLTVKCLGIIDTEGHGDAESTKTQVFQVVEEAGIKKEDVWACIVDNAAVMLKSIKLC